MFDKLHLLSQDVPEGGDGFRWKPHPYLRIAGSMPRGPAVFEWSARQRADLGALWRDPTSDGARERLAKDLAVFCEKLGWAPDVKLLEEAERSGEEYIVTISAAAPELYILPWEVVQVGAEGRYLSDYPSAQVRYATPGLEPRSVAKAPDQPGVLFAWSRAGGEVPSEEQAAAIRAAAEAGGVAFQEVADVDEVKLQAALDAGAPSVLHLLCHGLPGPDGEPSRLSWGAADTPSEITATRLARLLRRHDSAIQLVVLSTCGSGDGHDNPMLLGSLAQELHRKGIRSVVASRYPLSTCGACVMTRSLYDRMLREAWSLERALRYTREALLRVVDHGETHPGDAYGIQLYAYDTERFVSDNEVEAERPVLATYPFGTSAHPVPAKAPPQAELTLVMEAEPKLSEEELVAKLRKVAEDDQLTVAIPLAADPEEEDRKGGALSVRTTADGAQRLLGAWRSKALHVVIGVAVGRLLLVKGAAEALQSLFSAMASKLSAAAGHLGGLANPTGAPGHVVVNGGKIGIAAERAARITSKVAGEVGAAGQAGGAAGQVVGQAAVAGQAAATGGAGKLAATAIAIAGKVVSTKVAVVAVLSTVAVVGGAAVYRAQTLRPAAAPSAAADPVAASSPGPAAASPPAAHLALVPEAAADPAPPAAPGPAAPADTAAASPRAPGAVSPAATEPAAAPPAPTEASPRPAARAAPLAPGAASPRPGAPARPSTRTAVRRSTPPPAPPATPPPPGAPETVATSGAEPAPAVVEPPPAPADPPSAPGSASEPGGGAAVAADRSAGANGPGSAAKEPAEIAKAEPAPPTATAPAAPAAPAAQAQPVQLAPSTLELQRIAGDTDVHPSRDTRSAMIRNGVNSVKGTVHLCVDMVGSVIDTKLTEPTGYAEYDRKLIAAVRGWRFRPYVLNGQIFEVCSTAEFVYVPR